MRLVLTQARDLVVLGLLVSNWSCEGGRVGLWAARVCEGEGRENPPWKTSLTKTVCSVHEVDTSFWVRWQLILSTRRRHTGPSCLHTTLFIVGSSLVSGDCLGRSSLLSAMARRRLLVARALGCLLDGLIVSMYTRIYMNISMCLTYVIIAHALCCPSGSWLMYAR